MSQRITRGIHRGKEVQNLSTGLVDNMQFIGAPDYPAFFAVGSWSATE
jgi:hypothetical protein